MGACNSTIFLSQRLYKPRASGSVDKHCDVGGREFDSGGNNTQGAAFVVTSANGYPTKSSWIRTISRRSLK